MAPKLPCAGKAQQSRWPGPGGSGTSTPREGLCFAEGAEIGRTLALLLDPPGALGGAAPAIGGPSSDARLLLAVGA